MILSIDQKEKGEGKEGQWHDYNLKASVANIQIWFKLSLKIAAASSLIQFLNCCAVFLIISLIECVFSLSPLKYQNIANSILMLNGKMFLKMFCNAFFTVDI